MPTELIQRAQRAVAPELKKAARIEKRLHDLRAFPRRCVASQDFGAWTWNALPLCCEAVA
eukprot:6825316-Pyramimonas_sp.AAC.1